MTLSRALTLVLLPRYLVVAGVDGEAPLTVALSDLLLLQELAGHRGAAPPSVGAIAERTGAAPADVERALGELRRRGLLIEHGDLAQVDETAAAPEAAASGGPPPDQDGQPLVAPVPLVLRASARGFEHVDHDGVVRARLDAVDLAALGVFRRPVTRTEAFDLHAGEAGPRALGRTQFDRLVDRLAAAGLLGRPGADGAEARKRRVQLPLQALGWSVDRHVALHETTEREREARTGVRRTRIVPVDLSGNPIPLALGMIVAYARAHEGGRLDQHYQVVPEWLTRHQRLASLTEQPAVFLFSNYIWSHPQNLAVSAEVKRRSPGSVTIHGGPDTPKYEGDVEAYFASNSHVDVAVHGEGEVTTAEVLQALAGVLDRSGLREVAGISFRDGARVVRTRDRERLTDLDRVPSPYLTGVFDVHGKASPRMAVVETNRGCPYGCTFCDWGSATLARIRTFSLDRVFAELEWCATHKVERVYLADANFGILERDVAIAEKVAELRRVHGYPTLFSTNYAKNSTRHLHRIVRTLADAGILTEGLLSLQSMDAPTLQAIRRSNIKVERYDDLARQFREAKLPLFVDLMLGLPGATPASFRSDLQGCVDREVTAKIFPTELLVNSPMNDPAYRAAHRIETSASGAPVVAGDGAPRRLVVATSSYTRQDHAEMMQLRRVYLLCENFGVLRQVSRYVRQERGLLETDLYDRLRLDVRARPERWPTIGCAFRIVPDIGVPPVSWRLFLDEIERYVVDVLGVAADDALRTVLDVQHALLPARERRFPCTLALAHDYTAWHRAIVDAKDGGQRDDWSRRVPRLRELPPASFTVDDPNGVCARGLGYQIEAHYLADWELDSPVARALPAEHTAW